MKYHLVLVTFLILYLLFSFGTYKDYPISNGEEYRYLRGQETLDHFLHGEFKEKLIQPLPNYFLYNLYPLVLVALNSNFYYEWFHLINIIFASLGFITVYFLALTIMKNRGGALLCLLALVLFPGFFGQLAFNPVDMPFMVFYLLLLLALLRFSRRDTNHWSTPLLGLLFGVTQGLRQLGFTLYLVMIILDFYDYYFSDPTLRKPLKEFLKNRIFKYIYIFVIANLVMVITWPNFAINFFKSYYWYLLVGSNFYLWNFGLLFFGSFLENAQRPWYYLPFLQLITYPLYITAFFLPVVAFFKTKLKDRTYFIVIVTVALNYALYLILKPVLYDGIRHFLFLVPLVVLIAISNFVAILKSTVRKWFKGALVLGVALNFLILGAHTIRGFPYHYVYFNELAFAFGNPYKLFESDYSNTKYREAAEWIRDVYLKDESEYSHSNPDSMLKVYPCDNAYAVDYFSYKKFLTVIRKEDADLVLCDYRNLKQSEYKGDIVKTFYLNGYDVLYLLRLSVPS